MVSVNSQHHQLPLNLQLHDDNVFASFYPGANQAVVDTLRDEIQSRHHGFVYLWGPEGSGRTHLLQAACHQAQLNKKIAFYLPLSIHLNPNDLTALSTNEILCLDDLDAVVGRPDWENALFHLYNQLRDAGHCLWIAAEKSPHHLGVKLPDLQSRLSWGLVLALKPLSDAEKLPALQLHAHRRGLVLTDEVGDFLLRRVSRDMSSLNKLLAALDKASLTAQRKLTIPFVKSVLKL